MASLDVDPDDLRAHAARIESIRAALNPGALPVGFSPAGSDPASVVAANSISAQAAKTVNGLWSTWRKLGEIADKLRPTADGYQSQDTEAQSNLSSVNGGWSSGTSRPQLPTPEVAPVAVPHVYTASPAASPEQLSTAIHSGPGASSPEAFASAWSSHAGVVETAAADLHTVKASLGSGWSGIAQDGADRTVSGVHQDLMTQGGAVTKVSGWASTHAADFRTAVDPAGGVPHPNQFAVWNQNLSNAVAADQQYPGVYSAAVLQAQNDLSQGYSQTGTAYGQYAIDPVTGQAVDPVTGEPVDPVTGEPLGEDVADSAEDSATDPEQLLSMGGQLLTGLIGGAAGAIGAGVGAIAQAGQQGVQMATKSLGEIAKSAGSAPELDDSGLGGGLGSGAGDFGGGGGGGGGPTEPAAALGPAVGSAPSLPAAAPQAPAGPSVRGPQGSSLPRSMGMGGMPMMPMGGMGSSARPADAKSGPSPNGKKMVAPVVPNTQRVIGEIETDRISAKAESRKQKMEDRKEAKREQIAQAKANID